MSIEHSLRPAPVLAIVVPCYNEQEALPQTADALLRLLRELLDSSDIADGSYICFVDDGSRDDTWPMIAQLARCDHRVKGIKLSRNFGHQAAVLAGMFECTADTVATIDADLQDDETCIKEMVREYRAGSDLVLGVRDDRSVDTAFKRLTANAYYKTLRAMGASVTDNHADYRLLSRRAIDALRDFPETNLFLRGVIRLIGLPVTVVTYRRRARTAGQSKYPIGKMLALAWEGITSFSTFPLRVIASVGCVIALGSFVLGAWALWVRLAGTGAVPGWASTVLPIYFIGGVQILCIGLVGEYVGKTYLETKRRPRYLIQVKTADEWTTASDTFRGAAAAQAEM